MFLATDTKTQREKKIRRFFASDPGVGLVLAAVNFEWTVSRAVLFLGKSPNSVLRAKMADYHSLDSYKELWKSEVVAEGKRKTLADLVRNWSSLRKAFKVRHLLVHGRDRCTMKMANPHVEALLQGVGYIDAYCEELGLPLYRRMPIRRGGPQAPAE